MDGQTHHATLSATEVFTLVVCLYFGVTTLLGLLSGWFSLMRRFPDKAEPALFELTWQTGWMGLVGIGNALRLCACESGLRIGMVRLLGPFCRDFVVPWSTLRVWRGSTLGAKRVSLLFDDGLFSSLTVTAEIADQLWRAVPGKWPEQGPAPAAPLSRW